VIQRKQSPDSPGWVSSSRRRPLNDSIHAFCHGEPGSMNSEAALLNRHQSLTAWATDVFPVNESTLF
jgi:hypothetical protein